MWCFICILLSNSKERFTWRLHEILIPFSLASFFFSSFSFTRLRKSNRQFECLMCSIRTLMRFGMMRPLEWKRRLLYNNRFCHMNSQYLAAYMLNVRIRCKIQIITLVICPYLALFITVNNTNEKGYCPQQVVVRFVNRTLPVYNVNHHCQFTMLTAHL